MRCSTTDKRFQDICAQVRELTRIAGHVSREDGPRKRFRGWDPNTEFRLDRFNQYAHFVRTGHPYGRIDQTIGFGVKLVNTMQFELRSSFGFLVGHLTSLVQGIMRDAPDIHSENADNIASALAVLVSAVANRSIPVNDIFGFYQNAHCLITPLVSEAAEAKRRRLRREARETEERRQNNLEELGVKDLRKKGFFAY